MSSTSLPPGRSRRTADDWVRAGHRVLVQGGVEGLKIDRVAIDLDVTKGSFYWHFKNFAAFQEAMIATFIADGELQMATFEQTAPAEPRERLLSMMNRISDRDVSELERAMREWVNMGDDLELHLERIDHWGFDVVKAAFEQLGFEAWDAEVRAKALYYAGIGRIHTRELGMPETLAHREALLDILSRR